MEKIMTAEEWQRWYRFSYLCSQHWIDTREAAKARVGYRCQVCRVFGPNATCGVRLPWEEQMMTEAPQLDVHHVTYARLGQELPEDLEVLCRSCHDKRHRIVELEN